MQSSTTSMVIMDQSLISDGGPFTDELDYANQYDDESPSFITDESTTTLPSFEAAETALLCPKPVVTAHMQKNPVSRDMNGMVAEGAALGITSTTIRSNPTTMSGMGETTTCRKIEKKTSMDRLC